MSLASSQASMRTPVLIAVPTTYQTLVRGASVCHVPFAANGLSGLLPGTWFITRGGAGTGGGASVGAGRATGAAGTTAAGFIGRNGIAVGIEVGKTGAVFGKGAEYDQCWPTLRGAAA